MATTPISPKVSAAAAVGSIVGLFLSFANAATPDTFAALGKWSYPAFLAVSLGAALVAGWWKNDPLRAGKQDNALPDASATPTPAFGSGIVPGSVVDQKVTAILDATPAGAPAVDAVQVVAPAEVTPVFEAPADPAAETPATPAA